MTEKSGSWCWCENCPLYPEKCQKSKMEDKLELYVQNFNEIQEEI